MKKAAFLVVAIFALACLRESVSLSLSKPAARNPQTTNTLARRGALARILISSATCIVPIPSNARNLPQSTGADFENTGTVEALTPIVRIRQFLDGPVNNLIYVIPRDEQAFKRVFDEYSDPVSYKQKFLDQNAFLVYYTRGFDGPNRPGMEEDLPERQTLQYGARNEAWVSWEELQVELDYAKKYPNDPNDVDKCLAKMISAVDAYLQLAPPDVVHQAIKKTKQ
jgi:hypothetical protein